MTAYAPPLRDIRFVLDHLVDLPALLDADAEADAPMLHAALEEAGRFISDVVAPTNVDGDRTGSRLREDGTVATPPGFREAYRQFVEAGWASLPFPTAWGGHGVPWVVGIAIQEMMKSANMAFALCPMLTHSAIEALLSHGSEEQQAAYLEKLVSGEWTGTMLLTEPEAGSDVGALRARAVPADDGSWRLFGGKIFITWGEHDLTDNIVHMVLARTPDAPPGTKGISLFIVPKYLPTPDGTPGERNDIKVVSLEHKLGIHASPTCVMSMGDEGEGAVGYLVGEENQGMRYMFTMMNNARLAVGVEGLSISERAYQQALAWAQQRRQGRAIGASATEASLIIEHPDVRRMLMTMKASIEAMRALIYYTAAEYDRSRGPDGAAHEERVALLTPVAKAWPTDLGVEMTSLGIQVHGGMGYVEETGAAQHFRDARISPIYEGTNGIQAIDLVMRKLPLRGGEVVASLLEEMRGLDGDLAAAGDDLAGIRRALSDGVAVLSRCTDWLAACDEPNDTLAGATPYLAMFGTVTGGWLLAREALAAHRRLADAGGDEFLDVKLATARFYCEQLLPRAAGLGDSVTAGAAPLFALEPKQLSY